MGIRARACVVSPGIGFGERISRGEDARRGLEGLWRTCGGRKRKSHFPRFPRFPVCHCSPTLFFLCLHPFSHSLMTAKVPNSALGDMIDSTYSTKPVDSVVSEVWHIVEEKDDQNEQSCWSHWKLTLDRIVSIPSQVEKMLLYNMMVMANRFIDDPHTTFYTRLPDLLLRFGTILNMPLLDPNSTDTLSWSVPSVKVRLAYPKNYFVENPSLQIIWYDGESGQVRKYLVTVGFYRPTRQIGPLQVTFENATMSDNNISCTPMNTLNRGGKWRKNLITEAEYARYYMPSSEIPVIVPSVKQEIKQMKEFTPCDMANNIIKRKLVDVAADCVNVSPKKQKVEIALDDGDRVMEIQPLATSIAPHPDSVDALACFENDHTGETCADVGTG